LWVACVAWALCLLPLNEKWVKRPIEKKKLVSTDKKKRSNLGGRFLSLRRENIDTQIQSKSEIEPGWLGIATPLNQLIELDSLP
jgi:hypothetical protein